MPRPANVSFFGFATGDDAVPTLADVIASARRSKQKPWSDLLAEIRLEEVKQSLAPDHLRMLLSSATSQGSAVFTAHPLIKTNRMSDRQWLTSMKLRLGTNVTHASHRCNICNVPAADGLHALTCKAMNGYVQRRHTEVKLVIYKELSSIPGARVFLERDLGDYCQRKPQADAAATKRKQPKSSPSDRKQVDRGKFMDIIRMETDTDRIQFIDVVIGHPSEANNKDAGVPGQCAEFHERQKHALYDPKWVFTPDQTLVPFAIETGGAWGEEAISFLKRVASGARTHDEHELPLSYSHFYRRLTERVAVAIQRSVTTQILHYLDYQAGRRTRRPQSQASDAADAESAGGQQAASAADD